MANIERQSESFRTDNFNRENEYVVSRFAMAENCVRYVEGQFWLMDSGGTFSINKEYEGKLDKSFMGNLLLNKQKDIFMCARGGAQKNLNVDHFYELKIPLPPVEIQKEIVAEFENYQKIIDSAKQIVNSYKPTFRIDPKWKAEKLEKLCSSLTPPKKIQKNKYQTIGKYPIIDQSHNEIAGFTNDEKSLIDVKSGVVIFGDHTCSVKYSEIPFAQGADGIKILKTKENCSPKYLFYFLKADPVRTEGYKRHFGKLKSVLIPLPSIETQKQIVAKIEEEQQIVEANKKLIKLFEQKIKDKISDLWGE